MADDVIDWKLAWARWWAYIAIAAAILLVAVLAKWWVTVTVLGVMLLILAGNKYLFGRWFP